MGHVFVNRTLNLKRITHIGLDMDHTLIRYNSENFEALAYKSMQEKLVNKKKYPSSVMDLKFSFNLAIRGLVVDKRRGNLLKLSRYGAIRNSFHGLQPIDYKKQNEIYRSKYIDLGDDDFDPVDTTFSICFATLYAQMVELKNTTETNTLPDYYQIATDLIQVLDESHRDGSIKDVVKKDLKNYIIRDKKTIDGIERFRKHGKKFFIVTNSDYNYTKALLDYAISPFVKSGNWLDIFEFVINSAQKPRFFYDRVPFIRIDQQTEQMTPVTGPLTPGVYQGGCANQFTEDLHLDPDQILYVGDHIYGDIVRLKKSCGWRTALVVDELDSEVQSAKKASKHITKINQLMKRKIPIETKLDQLISEKIEKSTQKNQKRIDELMKKINAIDKQVSPLIQKQSSIYNKYWGEVMRVGVEESYFAYQVERFACVYMARLTDLLAQSPRTYFRGYYRRMPHEDLGAKATSKAGK